MSVEQKRGVMRIPIEGRSVAVGGEGGVQMAGSCCLWKWGLLEPIRLPAPDLGPHVLAPHFLPTQTTAAPD